MQTEYGDPRLIDIFCQFKFAVENHPQETTTPLEFFQKYYDIIKALINDETNFTKVEFSSGETTMRYPIEKVLPNTFCIRCGRKSEGETETVYHEETCPYLKDNYSLFYTDKGIDQLKKNGIITNETLKKFKTKTGRVLLPYMYNNMSRKVIHYGSNYKPNFPNVLFVQRKTIPIVNTNYCYHSNHKNGITTTFNIYPQLNETKNSVLNVPLYREDCETIYALEYIDDSLKYIFGPEIRIHKYLNNLFSTIRFGVRFNIEAIVEDLQTLFSSERQFGFNYELKEGAIFLIFEKIPISLNKNYEVKCKFIIRPSGIIQCFFTFTTPILTEHINDLISIHTGNLQHITNNLIYNKIVINNKYTLTKEQDKRRKYNVSAPDNLIETFNGRPVNQSVKCKFRPKPFSFTLGVPYMNNYTILQEGKISDTNLKKGLRLYEPCCGKLELDSAHDNLFNWKYVEEKNCELNINFTDVDTPQSKLNKLFESFKDEENDVNPNELVDCITRLTELFLCKDPKGRKTFEDGRKEDKVYCKLFRRTMYGFPNNKYPNDYPENNNFNPQNQNDAITCIPGTDIQETRQLIGLIDLLERNDKESLLSIVKCYIDYLHKLSLDPIDSAYFYFRVKRKKLEKGPGRKSYVIYLYELSDSENELTPFNYNEDEETPKFAARNALTISKYEYNQIKDGEIYKFTINYAWKLKEDKKIFPLPIRMKGTSTLSPQDELPKLNIVSNQTFDLDTALKRPDELDIATVNEIQKEEWKRLWDLLYTKER